MRALNRLEGLRRFLRRRFRHFLAADFLAAFRRCRPRRGDAGRRKRQRDYTAPEDSAYFGSGQRQRPEIRARGIVVIGVAGRSRIARAGAARRAPSTPLAVLTTAGATAACPRYRGRRFLSTRSGCRRRMRSMSRNICRLSLNIRILAPPAWDHTTGTSSTR